MSGQETPKATEPKVKQPKVAAPTSFETQWKLFKQWAQVESADTKIVAAWESRDADGQFVAQITQPAEGKLKWTLKTAAKRAKALDAGEATTIGGAVRSVDRAARTVLKQRQKEERWAAALEREAAAKAREAEPVGAGNGGALLEQVEDRLAEEMEAMR
jgi:VCBS repeat-containing protein